MDSGGSFSGAFIDLGHSFIKRAAVAQQGGLLNGVSPVTFTTADPFRLWVVQLGIIIIFTQLLSLGLAKLRQPRVIAEVLGGIILGPTAMGRIPGFTQHIFPTASRPYLSLTATIGLVLFMFLIGLELDMKMLTRNARTSLTIAVGGICLSFGLGAAISIPVYHAFAESYSKDFSHFMLFVGVSCSITAFPVLCRILGELKMLHDPVGIVVLSAGVGNDLVGWVLLALAVALVNAGSGIIALYVLLVSIGWVLVTLFPVKMGFRWLAKWTESTEKGPTPFFMTVILLFTFGSAFMTDIIGVHAIFGGFLAGLAVPREGALNILITEKLEDAVALIFLPIYFTTSGLNTDLGTINTGKAWGYTILLLVIDYTGKMTGGTLGGRFAGLKWRHAATVGTLMSCKGLLELIVLNVGLTAGILNTQLFSMFVFEALVLTVAATPVAILLHPPRLRVYDSATNLVGVGAGHGPEAQTMPLATDRKSRFLVVLDKFEHLSSIMSITQLVQPPLSAKSADTPVTEVDALRLIELTDRTSDLMRSSAVEELIVRDQLLNIYKTFGGLHNISVSDRLAVAQYETYHESVGVFAREAGAQMILLSWAGPSLAERSVGTSEIAPATNPLENLFRNNSSAGPVTRLTSVAHSHFIRRLFASAPTDVALFINSQQNSPSAAGSKVHLVVPFFGGPDDRLALEFAVQLCAREDVTATVFRMVKEATSAADSDTEEKDAPSSIVIADLPAARSEKAHDITNITSQNTVHSIRGFPDTIYPNVTTQTRLESDTADNICWLKYAPHDSSRTAPGPAHSPMVQSALARVTFNTVESAAPLSQLIQRTTDLAAGKRTIVVAGRGKRLAVTSHQDEMSTILGSGADSAASLGSEMRKTLGDVSTALVVSGVPAGLLVMQASSASDAMTA
ncbi:K(+)/H(+) antiporter [Tulasnella sp. JGI-2019a]|nr:K(+)/H(+) antiporter [Tulasnella sp. JGI-2019a]